MKITDIITENKHRITESISVVDQDYDLDQIVLTMDIEGRRVLFTYTDYDEDFENAERGDVFDQLMRKDWYKGLDHPTRMEILDAAYRAIRGLDPQPYQPTVGDEPMDVGDRLDEQGVRESQLDPYRLERLDPQSRRVLQRMADHAEPGSWLSASEAYAIMLGLQYKSRNPRGWEQEVQHYVDLWKEITGKKS